MRKRIAVLGLLFAASVLSFGANAAQATKLIVGSASGAPGDTVSVTVTLTAEGAQVAGTQNDITFDPSAPIARKANGHPDCTVNADIDKTASSFAFRPAACTAATCTSVRALVLSTDNVDAIVDGSVLYTCHVAISATATAGAKALTSSGVIASDPTGTRVDGTTGVDGSVTVTGGTGPTPTNTTAVVPTATNTTAVVPTATPTTGGSTCDAPRAAPSGNAIYIQDENLAAGTTAATISAILVSNTDVAGTQNDVTPPAGVTINRKANGHPDCTVNAAIDKTATSFAFRPNGCTAATCTSVRALVLSTDNIDPIPTGSVLYTCNVTVSTGGTLALSGTILSTPAGAQVAGVTSQDGIVCVGGGTVPTPTATEPAASCSAVRPAPSANSIYIQDENLAAGTTAATISAILVSNTDVAGTQNDITPPAGVTINRKANGHPDCTVNAAIDKTATSFAFRPNGCTAATCTSARALVLSTDNIDPIPTGSVLYTCNVTVSTGGTLALSGVILSTPAGAQVPGVTSQDGNLCVEGSVVNTPVPTNTATVAATATPTPRTEPTTAKPTATATQTAKATNTAGTHGTQTPGGTPVESESGCQINTTGSSSAAWLILIPALAMLVRRRSR